MKMKKLGIISLCVALLLTVFTGCSSSSKSTSTSTASTTTKKAIPDLKGDWKQENSKSDDSYQTAIISGDTIEIYWVSDKGDTKSLYWAGSFETPTTADEPYSWTSKNDHNKTKSSLLASNDDTKKITYQNGELSYEASAMGTTTKVKLKKQ
ncbi:hypothetical protein [Clostridium folliculivorans]|uniref:Lipoprotein n=1 Tax=Clostridium folliculivorans TaxID=2886038 RepID=A0A9W5XZY6_9CLOT|nr:hypothetical protein [Clostridium folliculivorans]GKU24067.1 hypothetical protein CFOLD11_08930 [Clostridium folliculivorans]GKU30181.1 hypothetical protein CFB3_22880 [Clostridium folliculivorans]